MENKGRNKSFTNSGALILLPTTTTECRIPKPRFFYLKAGTLTTKAKNNTLKTLTNLLLGFSLRLLAETSSQILRFGDSKNFQSSWLFFFGTNNAQQGSAET